MVQLSSPPTVARDPKLGLTPTQPRRRPSGNGVRTIFISDVHLGSRHAQAEALLEFLADQNPQYLYLVGDFIDGWELCRRWHWEPAYDRLLRRLLEMHEQGTVLRYTPGNHDNFLRNYMDHYGFVEIADEFVHDTANRKRFLVMHGDQFDKVELCAQWLSMIGAVGYDLLLWTNGLINRWRTRLGYKPCKFSAGIKKKIKQAVRYVSSFEKVLAEYARGKSCQGIICGHIHTPTISNLNGVLYCNSGDWVENCSALVELQDGSMSIVRWNEPATADVPSTVEGRKEMAFAYSS